LRAATFPAWLGIAKAKQWVSTSAWGWEQASIHEVLRSAALLGGGHLAVAWNEEMVFRGYRFETVREALGQGKAVAVLIPGFAFYHGLEPQQMLGMLAGGTTLMLLRLHSDALWLSVGYHWAWNLLQTAIFGASGSAPSIRPLHVHGPERWMGPPGCPRTRAAQRDGSSCDGTPGVAMDATQRHAARSRISDVELPLGILSPAVLSRAACRGLPTRHRSNPCEMYGVLGSEKDGYVCVRPVRLGIYCRSCWAPCSSHRARLMTAITV
jgi:Type II CAAX prenyl endopeptidase Rce1-like